MAKEAYATMTDIGSDGIGFNITAKYVILDGSNASVPATVTAGPFPPDSDPDGITTALARAIRTAENDQSIITLFPSVTDTRVVQPS